MIGRMPELTVSGTIGRGSINLALRVVDLSLQSHFTVHTVNTKLLTQDFGTSLLCSITEVKSLKYVCAAVRDPWQCCRYFPRSA
jgi:hypothetical protein